MKAKFRTAAFLVVWLVVIVLAYYFFFWRYIQRFDHQGLYPNQKVDTTKLTDFIGEKLGHYSSKDIVTFHWLNPDCNCLRFGGLYIEQLMIQTTKEHVEHVILTPPGKAVQLTNLLPMFQNSKVVALDESSYQSSLKFIPATPAAVVYHQKNQALSFLGPHSSGVICGKGTGFVELVLNNLEHGFDPALVELDQSGCFCEW